MERVHYMTVNKLHMATRNYVIAFTVELFGVSFEGGGGGDYCLKKIFLKKNELYSGF